MKVKQLLSILSAANPEGEIWVDTSDARNNEASKLVINAVIEDTSKSLWTCRVQPQNGDVIIRVDEYGYET